MEFKPTNKHTQKKHISPPVPQRGHRQSLSPTSTTPSAHTSTTTFANWFRRMTSLKSNTSLRDIMQHKKILIILTVVVMIVIGGGIYSHLSHDNQVNDPPPQKTSRLDYQTILPPGKSIQQLGGWQRVSPPEATPVYAYEDQIDGVGIYVSQQPLPDTFMENTGDKLDELAKGFNATSQLDMEGGQLYVGTSAKGPQSVMLIKNGLLILIKSQQKISNDAWVQYVETLK